MNIADNVLKHHLSHVYWVLGTGCAGKSTTTMYLSEKYNMVRYDSDNKYDLFKSISDAENQPQMNRKFADWEEYFNRSPEEYAKWLEDSLNEQIDMIVVDLLTMPKDRLIIVDGISSSDALFRISDYNHIVYLTTETDLAIDQFFDREDKGDLYELIMSLPESEKKLKNLQATLRLGHEREYNRIISSEMKYIIRQKDTLVEQMAEEMAKHFGLV